MCFDPCESFDKEHRTNSDSQQRTKATVLNPVNLLVCLREEEKSKFDRFDSSLTNREYPWNEVRPIDKDCDAYREWSDYSKSEEDECSDWTNDDGEDQPLIQ